MITRLSEMVHEWMGWCPNTPVLRTAPTVLMVPPENYHPAQPGDGGSAGSPGRVRRGFSIAAESLKAMLKDRKLLRFTFLSGLVMLFLIVAEGWNVTNNEPIPLSYIFIPLGDWFIIFYPLLNIIAIGSGESSLIFDMLLFLIEVFCLFCFAVLLAGLVVYRTGKGTYQQPTIREAIAGVSAYTRPLAALSVIMALTGTFLEAVVSQSQFFGKIAFSISMAVFNLPYAYYLPNELDSALYFSFKIMFINIVLFLVALYVVPVIVLEKKGLVPALRRSVTLMKKTWRELLGCALIFGAIGLGIAAIALVIGQSPQLLNHDFDFFINMSRGQVLMTAVCYGFILACWVMMAAGFTAAGIAITDLYAYGKAGQIPAMFEKN
jgi:hypothetical protein